MFKTLKCLIPNHLQSSWSTLLFNNGQLVVNCLLLYKLLSKCRHLINHDFKEKNI